MKKLFILYTEEDFQDFDHLVQHLTVLKLNGTVNNISSGKLNEFGQNWETKFKGQLEESDLIIPLVSASFLYHYCSHEKEIKYIFELYDDPNRKIALNPILLNYCLWEETDFAQIQMLPRDGKPIEDFDSKNRVFHNIAREIKSILSWI